MVKEMKYVCRFKQFVYSFFFSKRVTDVFVSSALLLVYLNNDSN